MRLPQAWTPLAAGAAACAAAIAVFATALFRSVTLEPLPDPRVASVVSPESVSAGFRDSLPLQVIARAVSRDPFRTDRRPPATPFRMPGEPAQGEREGSEQAAGDLKLIGTAVVGSRGGFAMCQTGTAAPRVVRLGQSLGRYTLASVSRGRAVFRGPDGKMLELRVSKTGES